MTSKLGIAVKAWWVSQFELGREGADSNVKPMEGLRGFAVFLVFLVHYVTLIQPWIASSHGLMNVAQAIHRIGNTGVDLFFVLSGYLIYGSLLSKQQPFFRFVARRIQRIYPAFSVVFVVYVVLSFIFPEQSKIPGSLVDAVTYLLANFLLLPGLFPIEPMITVAWSLSYEIFYYLLIPIAIHVLKLRTRSVGERVGLFLTVALLLVIYTGVFEGPVRLIMFLSGMTLFEALHSKSQLRVPQSWGALGLCVGLISALIPISGSWGFSFRILILFAAFWALCFTCFERPQGWVGLVFSWWPLRWLGNMSYSYYLIHGLTLKAAFLVAGKVIPSNLSGPMVFIGLLPIMFLLTVIGSAPLYLLIERPFSLRTRKKNRP